MKSAKIGAIFLMSILALAGIGMGYAAWTDTITVEGTVNTGNVDLVVVDYSGTWVWKVYGGDNAPADEIFVFHGFVDDIPNVHLMYPDCTVELIAEAYAEQAIGADGPIDDAVTITYDNLFPCIDFTVDVLFHYEGSIPVKINYANFDTIFGDADYPDWLLDLWNIGAISIVAYRCDSTGYFDPADPEIVDIGTQLHFCDYVILYLTIHLPQYWPDGTPTDDLMLRTGSFTAHIEVVQWNEYPYVHP